MPAPLKPEVQQRILELHQQGWTGSRIAREVGTSIATACRIVKGYRPQPAQSSWDVLSEEQRDRIREDHRKGYCMNYLSRLHGVDRRKLTEELPKEEGQGKTGLGKLLAVEQYVVEEYRQTSVGARELAKRYGVQERTLQSFLQMRGLTKARGGQNGEHNPQKKGVDNDRYWARTVVETSLGQKLPTGTVIHHMSEVPGDQTLSNLWLFDESAKHLRYHQQQLANLRQGGLLSANRLCRDNGGLWLPEILVHLQVRPDTTVQSLFDKQELTRQDLRGFVVGMGET